LLAMFRAVVPPAIDEVRPATSGIFNHRRDACATTVPGSAPALGRCRVRPAPDMWDIPPASGRIFSSNDPETYVEALDPVS
jgi:hypothetical protein